MVFIFLVLENILKINKKIVKNIKIKQNFFFLKFQIYKLKKKYIIQ